MKIIIACFLVLITLQSFICRAQEFTTLQKKIKETTESSDTLATARAWYKLGKYYDEQKQADKSIGALRKALTLAEKIENTNAVSTIANYLASILSYSGENDSAIIYYRQAATACAAIPDSAKLSKVLINLADEFTTHGDYVQATKNALRAVKIAEEKDDYESLAYFLQKTGEIYKTAGENKKWEEYVQRAYRLVLRKECSNIKAIAAIYNDLGGIAETHQQYDQALSYYDTLSEIGRKNDYDNAIRVALSNSATIFKNQGDFKKALNTAVEASRHTSQLVYQQIYDDNLLSELYLATKDLSKASRFAKQALGNSAIENYPDEKSRTLKILYQIEKKRGNSQKALEYFEQFKQLSDALRNKEVRTKIADLEMAYQTEKKEHQIETLTAENKLKNQRLRIGIFLLTILFVLILLILYILYIRKQQAELKQNDLQQQVLRTQMNPHFIFNVLGSIQNFMQNNDTKKAGFYLSQFASLIRATLENSTLEAISLSDELEMLRDYLELEKMRMPNRFNFQIITAEELESDFIFIPPMLLQPFIENAIKHGFNGLKIPGLITIEVSDKKEWVEFIIEDNGCGLSNKKERASNHRSMAMGIFEKRRKLIQQKHKKDFNFEIQNLSDINTNVSGVRITVNVPIIEDD
ncbi:MAG: histidine kinase [Prolixibacteraceae bacterium]|nr:histidine kinase [Prolixibacteraceae bacterium]